MSEVRPSGRRSTRRARPRTGATVRTLSTKRESENGAARPAFTGSTPLLSPAARARSSPRGPSAREMSDPSYCRAGAVSRNGGMTHQQRPLGTGFTAASTAGEVLRGIDLTGKNVIVTGGHGRLGLETTRALAQAGASVTVAARDPERAGRAIAGIPSAEVSLLDLVRPEIHRRLRGPLARVTAAAPRPRQQRHPAAFPRAHPGRARLRDPARDQPPRSFPAHPRPLARAPRGGRRARGQPLVGRPALRRHALG